MSRARPPSRRAAGFRRRDVLACGAEATDGAASMSACAVCSYRLHRDATSQRSCTDDHTRSAATRLTVIWLTSWRGRQSNRSGTRCLPAGGYEQIEAEEGSLVTDRAMADVANSGERVSAEMFETIKDFALMCRRPSGNLLSDPKSFSVSKRSASMGPITLAEFVVDSDLSIDFGERGATYWVHLPQSGHAESAHRGQAISAGAGSARVYTPEESGAERWAAGTRMICVEIDRRMVDDARSDALGGVMMRRAGLPPVMATSEEPARSWISLMLHFRAQLFRPDGILSEPLVGIPFADALVRGFLFAADQHYRELVAEPAGQVAPSHIRAALDIIEAEPHLPLTVSALATRCHISVRALQEGFRRHLATSPMAYLREVRLRRAHQTLLASDPSVATVTDIAIRWGFTNIGRFSAAHTARYNETPVATLRRI